MKISQIYECEFCHTTYNDAHEAEMCEKLHKINNMTIEDIETIPYAKDNVFPEFIIVSNKQVPMVAKYQLKEKHI